MDPRLTSPSALPSVNTATANTTANSASANAQPASNATINTADATSFSAASQPSLDPNDIATTIKELEQRISALEAQVQTLSSQATAPASNQTPAANQPTSNQATTTGDGVSLPNGVNLPPFPGANTPAANTPASNVPASNTPAANSTANAPASNQPTSNVQPGANTVSATSVDAQASPQDQVSQLRGYLKQLQAAVNDQLAKLDGLLKNQNDGKGAKADPQRSKLDRQQAGLQAVQNTLATAKLTGLTPEEEQVVKPALARVHEIGQAIGNGDDPNQYAAELYSLKYTLQDPAGAGRHQLVTGGAQVVGQVNQQKTEIQKQLEVLDQKKAQGQLTPQEAQQRSALRENYKALIDIEKALDDAKLTRLSPEAQKRAGDAINQLGDITDALGSGKLDPKTAEEQIFRAGQALKNPGGSSDAQQVNDGAAVLKQIAAAKENLQGQLRQLDAKVMNGEEPEKVAAERERLLENGQALDELADVVKGAKLDQSNPAAKREVASALQKASDVAQRLGSGESPAKSAAEVFVLKQTFEEPIASKDNAAVQSGAAAIQMISSAEAKNLKDQQAIAAKIQQGDDPRKYDTQVAQLRRQEQDLRHMRLAIEKPDFGGLSNAQEAHGAKLIDQMRDLAMKVAGGADFTKIEKPYNDLATQLADLRHWGAAKPTPKPPSTTAAPGRGPLEPGAVYRVKNGDYLTKLAREKFGDATRYKDIVELNKDKYPSLVKNPDLIYPGWTLILPKQ